MRQMKYIWSSVIAGLFFGLSSMTAFSADLLTVYQQALENDDVLKAARNENQAVQQVGRQKRGLYYPSLDLGYDSIQTTQVINRSDNEVFGSGKSDFPTDVLSLSLNQPIFRLGFFQQRKVAKAEMSQADYLLSAAEQELMLRSAESYLLTLAALDNEYVTKTEGDVLAKQLKLTEKRLDVGLANPAEVYESRARLEFNQSEVIAAENAVIDQEEGLRIITGVAIDDLIPLKDEFEMVPPDPADQNSWIDQALQNNLAMRALESALDVATAEYKVQKAGYYPTIDFVARFNNRDSGGSLFGGGSDVDTTDFMIRGNWNVFQGGITRARVKEAFYVKQRAEDDLKLKRANVRRDTRNAYLGVVSSIAKARALKSSMESQAYTVKAKRKGFETGAVYNIQVLDAERDFFFVQRDYLKARYQYFLSLLRLKLQIGSLSPDDLKMINGLLKTDSKDPQSGKAAKTSAIPAFDSGVGKPEPLNATSNGPLAAPAVDSAADKDPEPVDVPGTDTLSAPAVDSGADKGTEPVDTPASGILSAPVIDSAANNDQEPVEVTGSIASAVDTGADRDPVLADVASSTLSAPALDSGKSPVYDVGEADSGLLPSPVTGGDEGGGDI